MSLTPPDFPYFLLVLPFAFILFMAYGYVKTGKFIELFIPDSALEPGNQLTRNIFSDLGQSIKKIKLQSTKFSSIHDELDADFVFFEHEFAKFHEVVVRDVANVWINNRESNVGISYQFALIFFIDEAKKALAHLPEYSFFEANIHRSIEIVVSQYDWDARS